MNLDTLLAQVHQADLLRFSTAGSVDDGKSTLIGRLLHDAKSLYQDQLEAIRTASAKSGQTGIDWALATDGLRAEREQRITIDVAYRHFSTPRRRFIIADTPGHEQYTRNMVTGASTADLAVILIDATRGVLPQSRRHGYLASLLGIRKLVVAVNKMDLVDYRQDVFDRIRSEYRRWAERLPSASLDFIPLSALQGDNVVEAGDAMDWYDGPPLLRYLETVEVPRRESCGLRLPIQHVLRPNGTFRGYCGTIAAGQVELGGEVVALPSGRRTRVSRILCPDGERNAAGAPRSVTLCLTDDLDLGRGDLLASPDEPPVAASTITADLVWMAEAPLDAEQTYLVKQTTRMVRGHITELHGTTDPTTLERQPADTLALNDVGHVTLRLLQPLVCEPYAANRSMGGFILIDPLTNGTVAAGMITSVGEPAAPVSDAPVPSRNLTRHVGRVGATQRAGLLGQQPVCLWLTGLSGAGKSTVAYALEERLIAEGQLCVVLDGDNVRHGLNCDLGFSPEDRGENIRRVAEVAKLFCEAGLIVITAFISPYREDRAQARAILGETRFIETFVDAPLDVCEDRDPKGLYRKARAGQIPEFTGVSAPYESPDKPGLRLPSGELDVDDLVELTVRHLQARGVFLTSEGA